MSIDWKNIETEYVTSDISQRQLAEKYGICRSTIGKKAAEGNWIEKRNKHRDSVVTKTVAAVESAMVSRARKVQTVADKLLNKIEAMVDGENPLDTKAIRALTAAVKDLKEIQGVRSELDEQEQKARIAHLQKQAEKDNDTSAGAIEVVFNAGPEEWNE